MAEAFAIALERWPVTGMPPNPGGWITTTARNRAVDRLRRESKRSDRQLAAHRLSDAGNDLREDDPMGADLDGLVEVIPDDQLRLFFMCCHPALSSSSAIALTLRAVGGLTTSERVWIAA